MLLDYNNNYADATDKAIVFHCDPVAPSMLKGKGEIIEHLMFKKSFGEGTGVGVNKGEIKEGAITFGSVKTENGKVYAFVSEGDFTDDEIEPEFFGTGKVIRKNDVNSLSNYMAENGYKHHLAITFGKVVEINTSSAKSRPTSIKNCTEIARLCAKYGVPLVLSSDAHFASFVGDVERSIEIVKAAAVPEELILNADEKRFAEFLEKKLNRKFKI